MSAVTAIILVRCEGSRLVQVAQALVDLEEVHEVYSVSGDVDVIVIVRFKEFDEIADIIPNKIAQIPGVVKTSTYVAFRQYSRRDIDDVFDLD